MTLEAPLPAPSPVAGDALADALSRLGRADALAVPYLDEATRAALAACCAALTFREARPVLGKPGREVYQDLELTTDIPEDSPLLALAQRLRSDLRAVLDRMEPPPLDYPFVVNDFIVQRYAPGRRGITPHRDHVRYRGLVAIIVLGGTGRFWVCDDRKGGGRRDVPAPPGSLLLMRAPDFAGRADRPFHALSDVTETRYSFGMRYDASRSPAGNSG